MKDIALRITPREPAKVIPLIICPVCTGRRRVRGFICPTCNGKGRLNPPARNMGREGR